jgi:hypothetical protein
MRTVVVAALLLIVSATLAPAAEVILKNGVKLEGEVVTATRDGFELRIAFGNDASGNSVLRPISWTNVASMDGLSIADWIREHNAETDSTDEFEEPGGRQAPKNPRELLDRFFTWLAACDGMNVYQRIASLFLLVLIPGFVLLWSGRLMDVRGMDGARAFGASILSFGGAALALKAWPGWLVGLPLAALGAILVINWRVIRPPLGRGIALFVFHIVSLVGVMLGVLYISRFLP